MSEAEKALQHEAIDSFYELLDSLAYMPMHDRQALLAAFAQWAIDLLVDEHRAKLRLIPFPPKTFTEMNAPRLQ